MARKMFSASHNDVQILLKTSFMINFHFLVQSIEKAMQPRKKIDKIDRNLDFDKTSSYAVSSTHIHCFNLLHPTTQNGKVESGPKLSGLCFMHLNIVGIHTHTHTHTLHLVLSSRMLGTVPPLHQYVFIAWCLIKRRIQINGVELN